MLYFYFLWFSILTWLFCDIPLMYIFADKWEVNEMKILHPQIGVWICYLLYELNVLVFLKLLSVSDIENLWWWHGGFMQSSYHESLASPFLLPTLHCIVMEWYVSCKSQRSLTYCSTEYSRKINPTCFISWQILAFNQLKR